MCNKSFTETKNWNIVNGELSEKLFPQKSEAKILKDSKISAL